MNDEDNNPLPTPNGANLLTPNGSAPIPPAQANPANPPERRVTEATRIPMSLPQTKLSVPPLPGYFLYWFLGQNVPRAIKAGYEFVSDDEVDLANTGLADDASRTGNTDLGSRVSLIAGGFVEGTMEPQRHYLMKLRQEWRDKDVEAMLEVNERVAASIRGGQPMPGASVPGETAQDRAQRYLKKGQDLFIPKRR